MTRKKNPEIVNCQGCGKGVAWMGGRKRRYCTPECRYRTLNPPKIKVKQPSLAEQHRAIVKAEKLNRGHCVDCGLTITEETYVCIDFDHRDPTTKTFTISYVMGRAPVDAIINEMAKCDAVCRNCHALRTHKGKHYLNKQRPKIDTQLTLEL